MPADTLVEDTSVVVETDVTSDTDIAADTDVTTDTDVAALTLPAYCAAASDTDAGGTTIGGTPEPRTLLAATGDLASVIDGLTALDWRLFGELDSTKNSVFSPFSLAAALAVTWDGANGATQTELATALGITLPDATWRTQLAGLIADLEGTSRTGGADVRFANRLFGSTNFPWLPDYLALCQNSWNAPFEALEFAPDPEPARQHINAWVGQQTCGLIPELYAPEVLTAATQLVLANAILVNADWATEFLAASTAPAPFYLAGGGTVPVDFMTVHTRLPIARPGDFTVAQIPLQGSELGFWVVMPDAADGLDSLPFTGANFATWAASATEQPRDLFFPRYQQSLATDAVAALKAVGVTTLFDRDAANLSGMSSTGPLWVASIQHTASIVFDEIGLHAAAATGVGFEADTADASSPSELHIDRPFLFILRDELTGTVLFMGRTVNPNAG